MPNTLSMLQKEINKRAIGCLENDVYKIVKREMKDKIRTDVYGAPKTQYVRRKELLKDANIVGKVNKVNFELNVMNKARANTPIIKGYKFSPSRYSDYRDTMFSYWINNGEWLDIGVFFKTGTKKKRAPRPFIDNTQNEINTNPQEIIKILKKRIGG